MIGNAHAHDVAKIHGMLKEYRSLCDVVLTSTRDEVADVIARRTDYEV